MSGGYIPLIQKQLLIATVLLFVTNLRAADSPTALRDARQHFQVQMRKKSVEERILAIENLAKFTDLTAVELILKRGAGDPEERVRKAVQAVLRQAVKKTEVWEHLRDELQKQIKRSMPSDSLPELLRCLSMTESEEQTAAFVKLLDEYLASPKGVLLIPMTLIDDLGKQHDSDAVRAIRSFSKARAFETKFGYQRCVIQAMIQIPDPAAVQYLIEYLPQSRGLIQHDIVQYLTKLTSQKFADNDRLWYKWWTENKSTFEFPPGGVPPGELELANGEPTYYGIPVCAKRIVFVLDTSGSMRGAPLEAAKRALLHTIEQLPDSVKFDVVMFDKSVAAWQPRLLAATRQAKDEASRTVMSRGMGNGTHSFAALEAAFRLEPEAIYFLSDGRPTDSQPDQIFHTFFNLNRERRVSLHTIGLVTNRDNAADLILFMKPLAEKNWGSYRLIE